MVDPRNCGPPEWGPLPYNFVGAEFYIHTLADSSQCIRIREKTLEFSSTVLSTLSPYLCYMSTFFVFPFSITKFDSQVLSYEAWYLGSFESKL